MTPADLARLRAVAEATLDLPARRWKIDLPPGFPEAWQRFMTAWDPTTCLAVLDHINLLTGANAALAKDIDDYAARADSASCLSEGLTEALINDAEAIADSLETVPRSSDRAATIRALINLAGETQRKLAALEREVTDHAQWAAEQMSNPESEPYIKLLREKAALESRIERALALLYEWRTEEAHAILRGDDDD